MKFTALLLVIFSGLLYLFGSGEKERVETMASVAGFSAIHEAHGYSFANAKDPDRNSVSVSSRTYRWSR